MTTNGKVNAKSFYSEYSGHKVKHLKQMLPRLRASSDRLIWTAGDSSLDNKYWFNSQALAPGVYGSLLEPAVSKKDVTYWLNYLCSQDSRRQQTVAINAAVEASTLNERTLSLRPQDRFLRDNIQERDILVVSVGGNDIALLPCPCTIASILGLLFCMPTIACVENGWTCGAVPFDDCCCGCGASLCSCACACPPCLGYFRHLFGTRIQKYIEALTAKTKPAKILVCMIYYPDERNTPSWAGPALGALGYNSTPAKLQTLIRKTFEEAISTIRIPGTHVVPTPLFRVLDGKDSSDYIARVEPSPSGGRKMAEFILDMIDQQPSIELSGSPSAPLTTPMDRTS